MTSKKKPDKRDSHWICPICGWLNPYSNEIHLSNPFQIYYECHNCDYAHDEEVVSKKHIFRSEFPEGKIPL